MAWKRTDSAKLKGVSDSTLMLRTSDGDLHVDHRRNLPGRGAWFHPEARCLDLARRKRALGRSLRRSVEMTDEQWAELGKEILSAAHRAPDNE